VPSLDRTGDVYVLDLGDGENRINPDLLAGVSDALDEVSASPAPRGLVTTASGKFFSIGLDLGWIAANPDGVPELVAGMHELFARMLELPLPTVAALPRHAYAGGGLFALTHDYRVMREDRGYFGLPEVDGAVAFTPGVTDLVKARLAPQVAHEAMTSGRRYTGPEALAAGIVDELAGADELAERAADRAQALAGKDPDTYGTIKSRIYRDVLSSLRDAEANFADFEKFRKTLAIVGLAGS
jgi:enoyl-CoA hydratase/carnithine racemase